MSPQIPSSEVREVSFRTVLRGLDRAEVQAFVERVADHIEELEAEVSKLRAAAESSPTPDLETEFDSVGREVASILQAAREAAEAMRERAAADAARWRSEALAEADANRREAAADAEALRRDAWVTGSTLLEQAAAEAKRAREQAERDVLTVMGEAEREAHRLTSAARREAEDLVRNASMTAEKTTVEAERRRDDIIEAANRQAAAAQERTRALEQRRDELLEELESVRATLSKLESSLDERRDQLELSASTPQPETTSVKVVPPPAKEGDRPWEVGETVRVVPGESRIPRLSSSEEPATDEQQEEWAEEEPLQTTEPVRDQGEPMTDESDGEAEPTPPEDAEEAEGATAEEPVEAEDVDSLFAALRSSSRADTGTETVPEPTPDSDTVDFDGHDWIEDRDARLLPITNRALRGAKKSITELQNIALDRLRTDDKWRPDPKAVAETLGADLITLWAESFAAGHSVAEEMTGAKLKRPPTPHSDAVDEVPQALAEALSRALDEAGEGQRERQSAASRVFRVWRSDEAEQRLRELAIKAYQDGVERSVMAARD